MTDSNPYDLIVIGGGPGGYVASIRCAQQGMRVACIDQSPLPGGTCLREGCIPSKVLLESSAHFDHASHQLAQHGVMVETPRLDLTRMMKRKDQTVHMLGKGVESLFKKHEITFFQGMGTVQAPGQVSLTLVNGDLQELKAERILLAMGSESVEIPQIPLDGDRMVTSSEALCWQEPPAHLLIVGGGYIGLELGSVWRRLGSRVTVVESQERILPAMDEGLAKEAQRLFARQGMVFMCGQKVLSAQTHASGCMLAMDNGSQLEGTHILTAVGRMPRSGGEDLKQLGIQLDERGFIRINEQFETSVKGIYALGDLVPGPMLAHKAEEEAVVLAKQWNGQPARMDYERIPSVIYTHPEIASIGWSEEHLTASQVPYKKGTFHFRANGRARAVGQVDGWVKMLADPTDGKILGVHILGEVAGELIHEAAVVMRFGGAVQDLAEVCHAHPTFSEALKESALAVDEQAIHA